MSDATVKIKLSPEHAPEHPLFELPEKVKLAKKKPIDKENNIVDRKDKKIVTQGKHPVPIFLISYK